MSHLQKKFRAVYLFHEISLKLDQRFRGPKLHLRIWALSWRNVEPKSAAMFSFMPEDQMHILDRYPVQIDPTEVPQDKPDASDTMSTLNA